MRLLQEIHDVERRLAEKLVGTLLFQHQQAALNDADGRRRDVSVLTPEARGALAHLVDDGTQIPEIEDRHFVVARLALVLGPAESDIQDAFLRLGQLHQARRAAAAPSPAPSRAPDGRQRRRYPRTPSETMYCRSASSRSLRRARPALATACPSAAMPERSPLMSAANTGTPAAEKPSANTCSVTVLPVPVAPVTRPWRLASASSMHSAVRSWPDLAAADEDQAILHIVARIGDGLAQAPKCRAFRSFPSSNSSLGTQRLTTVRDATAPRSEANRRSAPQRGNWATPEARFRARAEPRNRYTGTPVQRPASRLGNLVA